MAPRARLALVAAMSAIVAAAGVFTIHSAVAAPTAKTFPPCKVSLAASGTTSTATIISGCSGPDFSYASFLDQHGPHILVEVSGPPWTVKLPACGLWQTDFNFDRGGPNHHLYAASLGGSPCTFLSLRAKVFGGTATVADFDLEASGPTDISGISDAPSVTLASVPPGTFTLRDRASVAGYTASGWDCTDAAETTASSVTLDAGESALCVITFTLQAAATTTTTTVPKQVTSSTTVSTSTTTPTVPVAPVAPVTPNQPGLIFSTPAGAEEVTPTGIVPVTCTTNCSTGNA